VSGNVLAAHGGEYHQRQWLTPQDYGRRAGKSGVWRKSAKRDPMQGSIRRVTARELVMLFRNTSAPCLVLTSLTIAVVLGRPAIGSAQARFDVLHTFPPTGVFPAASLVRGSDGDLYGTTCAGGATSAGMGTAFKMSPGGAITILHAFSEGGAEGACPSALVEATDGNFYGTTRPPDGPGASSCGEFAGTVFRMTPTGAVTVLHVMNCFREGVPYASLVRAADGAFYGTTGRGGPAGMGTVFRVTATGMVTVLHAFARTEGASRADLIIGNDGLLYGTTSCGEGCSLPGAGTAFSIATDGAVTPLHVFTFAEGAPSTLIQSNDASFYGTLSTPLFGAAFTMTRNGSVTILHAFTGVDGEQPSALLQAADGNFYGTTYFGGAAGKGTIFTMTPAGVVTVRHSFPGAEGGAFPGAALIQDLDGSFYGTTSFGARANAGAAFRMSVAGSVTVFPLARTDGARPTAALVKGGDGAFYGTTRYGGASDCGSIFRMTPNGTVGILYSFTGVSDGGTDSVGWVYDKVGLAQGTDGHFYGAAGDVLFRITANGTFTVLHRLDYASEGRSANTLTRATDGNFYGTTQLGGSGGWGTAFRMAASGAVTVLHSFGGSPSEGGQPFAAMVHASDGNFYGTMMVAGSSNRTRGATFRMTSNGTVTILHVFDDNTDGVTSTIGPLVEGRDGNLYGTTYGKSDGSPVADVGTLYRMSPAGTVTILHHFTSGGDGSRPLGALVQAADGDFYGTTSAGSPFQAGTVFRMTPAGSLTTLHAFTGGADGGSPYGGLVEGADGQLYGTTYAGGSAAGVLFRIIPLPPAARARAGDFDGDGKADVTVYRPSTGNWYVLESSTNDATYYAQQWGVSTDIPVPGDYDGDGLNDLAVYRPSTGYWYLLQSSTNYTTYYAQQWGLSTDIPVPGDYDGDRKSDLGLYQPSTGYWNILQSGTNYTTHVARQWGLSTDTPVAGDYDGDGKTDFAVYRPATGYWYILLSSTDFSTYISRQWGQSTDIPVPGDYDGDGKTDLAVYRPATGYWYVLQSSTSYTTYVAQQWGLSADIPVPGDYDGDGLSDLAVYRPSTGYWYLLQSSTNYATYVARTWGLSADVPVLRR
jgi:uncharacterized repeat protein (TIGR03803 family)